jgi:hypothetical protein
MAINFDHTSSANITLKGPEGQSTDNFVFTFPNVAAETNPTLLISGETAISAISGLTSALSNKVEKSTTGSAALLNYGTSAGQVVRLDENGKIPSQLISSVVIRDVFTVTNFSELTMNDAASIGDIGIVSSENKNYVLCSSGANAYATSSNWKEIAFPVQTVTSVNGLVGDVVLSGSNVLINSGNYSSQTIDYAIGNLGTVKASLSSLIDYAQTGFVTGCLANYVLSSNLTTTLQDYETTGALNTTLQSYSTTSEINTTLENYVLASSTGSAASLNVGLSAGNVVQLNNNGKIPNEVVPHLAITDTFLIDNSGALTSLTSAQKGDIAIATGSNRNYILKESDYSDINHWAQFAASLGNITGVNDIAPVNGVVTLTTTHIDVADSNTIYDGETISYAVSGLNSRISEISNDYLTDTEASDLLSSYVTTGYATGIFNSKSDVGHTHEMSGVVSLTGCLASISAFCVGDGASSAVLRSSANPHYNQAIADYSVALGQAAKTTQAYEIAQGAGLILNGDPGQAQVSKLVEKATTNNDNESVIAQICMQNYSNILFSSYIVGRSSANNKYAAFKVNGSANRENNAASTQVIGDVAIDTYVNTNSDYSVSATANTTDGKVEISVVGDASNSMQWVTSTTVTKIIWD